MAARRGIRATVVALVCAAGAVVAAPAQAASSFTIRTSDGIVTKIGGLSMQGASGGTLGRAIKVFGRPSKIDPVGDGSDGCVVTWRRLRLRATFANFGLASACSRSGGRLQKATIRGSRFRTTRGVRVGTRSSTIREKHRDARFVSGSWWIAEHVFPYGDGEEATPTVRALVSRGRVRALSLWVGAAGD